MDVLALAMLNKLNASVDSKLDKLFIKKTYTYKYSLNANSAIAITASLLNTETPAGYKVFGFRSVNTGSDFVFPRMTVPQNSGASSILRLINVGSDNVSDVTCTIQIIYVKSEYYHEVN